MKPFKTITVILLVSLPLVGLSQTPGRTAPAPKSSPPPRTLDGKPDLQGYWTNITVVDGDQAKDGTTRANGRDITLADGRKLSVSAPGTGSPEQ